MKNKTKLIGYSIGIVLFIVMLAGVSYAMYRKTLYNVNISGEIKNLDEYVVYSKGVNISSGTLNPVSSYLDGTSTSIKFYKKNNTTYDIYGHIYFDINSMTTPLSHELKYTIVDNSTSNIVSEGSFYTYSSGSSLLAAANIPLNNIETTYTIYVWLDEELYDSSTASNSFNIDIRCYATMRQLDYASATVPNVNSAANYIKYLYDSRPKSTATVNSITYNLAPSVNLMNDRLASMSTDINGGNIRYYSANPNNYVWLGDTYIEDFIKRVCVDNGPTSSCSDNLVKRAGDKKLWRIIGVFDGKIKLISEEPIFSTGISWDTSSSSVYRGCGINQWGESTYSDTGNLYEGSDLMKLLNPGFDDNQDLDREGNAITVNNSLYWNKGTGTVYSGQSNATTNDVSFANTGLSDDEKRMIDSTLWYLGNGNEHSYVDVQYVAERQGVDFACTDEGCINDEVQRTSNWIGKVGLIYASDFGYATDLNVCNRYLSLYVYNECADTNWLNDYTQWTISIRNRNGLFASSLISSQGLSLSVYKPLFVRPAIYLKSDVIILTGDGTENNPYVLSLR